MCITRGVFPGLSSYHWTFVGTGREADGGSDWEKFIGLRVHFGHRAPFGSLVCSLLQAFEYSNASQAQEAGSLYDSSNSSTLDHFHATVCDSHRDAHRDKYDQSQYHLCV